MNTAHKIKISFQDGSLSLLEPSHKNWMDSVLQIISSDEVNCLITKAESFKSVDMRSVSGDGNEDGFWPSEAGEEWMNDYRPYNVENGVLTVDVRGMLLNGVDFSFGSYFTGYEYLSRAISRAENDPNVSSVVFNINSPGGHAEGNFELHDQIKAMVKPTSTFASHAYSAAYSIAAATNHITVGRLGSLGSIGVVVWHQDISEHLEQNGVKMTPIYAGEHKVDGNPFTKLSDNAKNRMQSMVNDVYGLFVDRVANGRNLSVEAVKNTQALTYGAIEAVEQGLGDEVGTLKTVLSSAVKLNGEVDMSNDVETIALADHEQAVDSATADGRVEGANLERERIDKILNADAAKANMSTAMHIATKTNMSADEAIALLGTMSEQTTATNGSSFDAAMQGTDVKLGSGELSQTAHGDEPDLVASTLANYKAYGGNVRTQGA